MSSFRNFNLIALSLTFVGVGALAYVDAFALKLFPPADNRDYLVSLRENSEMGCFTYRFRQPDVLFIGDSHSYADWDFVELEQAFQPLKVSVCAMGGLYVESAAEILSTLKPNASGWPKAVIYGVSARQFIDGKSKSDQLAEHHRTLFSGTGWGKVLAGKTDLEHGFDTLKTALRGGRLPEWGSWDSQQKRIEFHLPQISGLKEPELTQLIAEVNNRSRSAWVEFLANAKITDDAVEHVRHFCEIAEKRQIRLFLVDLPESPALESLYSSDLRAKYFEIRHELGKCGKWVSPRINEPSFKGNRFFVNRAMSMDYPYRRLSDALSIKKETESFRNELYDLDHMNLIGAHVFTQAMIPELKTHLFGSGR